MGYNSTTELVANTEREILASAFDLEPEDLPGHIDDEADNDLEQLEGWDGEPLSDEEGFESAVNGHSESGIDRPLALSEGERYEAEIAARDERMAAMQNQINQLAVRADPGAQARAAQARETAIYDMLSNPEQTIAERDALRGEVQRLQKSRVEASLRGAHLREGDDFAEAYRRLTSLDPNNRAACALVQGIWDDPDPGKALMNWYEMTGGGQSLRVAGGRAAPDATFAPSRRGGIMPSLNSGTPASSRGERSSASRGRSDGWPVGEDDGGYADDTTERDIMQSAFR